jgi:hypothetical protein
MNRKRIIIGQVNLNGIIISVREFIRADTLYFYRDLGFEKNKKVND